MDTWFPPPLTAFEMEARRAAAKEGRLPPSDPAMVPIQYPHNSDYNFSRVISRSCSNSSSGTPPPFTEEQPKLIPSQFQVDPEVSNNSHPSCSSQDLPISGYNEEHLNYLPEWKAGHQTEIYHSTNYSVVCTNSNNQDLQSRKRPSTALQVIPIVKNGFQHGGSPSSSPLSAYDHDRIGAMHSRPNGYPASYTFIDQVFKPLYQSEQEKQSESQPSYSLIRDSQSSETGALISAAKSASSKESSQQYRRVVVPGGRKAKKSNEKCFPCPDCGRMFARAFNMETHRKTHIGYRPHHCPQCKKSFSRRHDVQRHLAAVHFEQSKPVQQDSAQSSRPQAR